MQKQVLCLAILSFLGFWCQIVLATGTADLDPEPPIDTPDPPQKSKYAHCEGALFPEPSCCGLQMNELSGRIYGGRETKINEFPWLVYVNITKILVNGIPNFCGGSLINTRWVLSAAHCFVNPKINLPLTISMNFGEWNIETVEDCEYPGHCAPEVVIVEADKIFPHEEYNPLESNHLNDIALIRLRSPVQYSDFIQPICLPWDGLLDDERLIGKIADVAGWGRTETNRRRSLIGSSIRSSIRSSIGSSIRRSIGSSIKLKVKVKVLDPSTCPRDAPFNGKQICAGGIAGVDSCHGDSGGPLMMQLNTTLHGGHFPGDFHPYYQIGLVSYSEFCGVAGEPGIYTRISSYLQWIRETIRLNK